MIRKIISLLLCFIFVFCAAACGKQIELKETDFYSQDILNELREVPGQAGRLPGFAEDLCVLPKEGFFDENLIEAPYAGHFRKQVRKFFMQKLLKSIFIRHL